MSSRSGYFSLLRRQASANGMCTTCRKKPRIPGRSKCERCRERQRAVMVALRASKTPDRCIGCRRPARIGCIRCDNCAETALRSDRAVRRKRVAEWRCQRCGSPVAPEGGVNCCIVCSAYTTHRIQLARALRHG